MTDLIIPKELEEMIKDIVAYEELNEYSEEHDAREPLYIEIPYYDDYIEQEEEWKIEIML